MAYQLYSQISSIPLTSFSGIAVLPKRTPVPYRVTQLDWLLIDQSSLSLAHEIDRAWVAFHPSFGEITIGRQAIGYGRGVLFSAVDIFAPFSPLEVDREWRPGVDAVHAEVRASEHLSADVAAGFGDSFSIDKSAFIGRVRGFVGDVDGALLFGRRATDWMFAATSSAAVGDASVYGEAAWFYTNGQGVDGGWLGSDRWVAKFVAGVNYSFDIGTGLKVFAEYHYSGFGFPHILEATTLLAQPAYQARFLRGDSQILGRHAFALVASYDPFSDSTASLTAIMSPVDGSGLVSPSLTWTMSDRASLVGTAFFPWGAGPQGVVLHSEWGSSPLNVFVQARLSD